MSHLRRMVPYESVPLPERKKMDSAGENSVEDGQVPHELKQLHELLSIRLAETK
jgi:hypothetical protein